MGVEILATVIVPAECQTACVADVEVATQFTVTPDTAISMGPDAI